MAKAYQTPNMQSFVAGEDLSAKQYTFVKYGTTEGQVIAVSSAADIPCGVLMNAPVAGREAQVAMPGGGAWLVCDSGASAGSFISTGADGKGEKAAAASDKFVAAIVDAISSTTTSANDRVPVVVTAFVAASVSEDSDESEAVSFAAAAGGANVCEVTATVKNAAGATLAGVRSLLVWLSDAATGAGLTGTSASGTVQVKAASGADFGALTAKKALMVQTLADGTYVLEITDSAKTGFYVCATDLGSGKTSVSTQLQTADYGS